MHFIRTTVKIKSISGRKRLSLVPLLGLILFFVFLLSASRVSAQTSWVKYDNTIPVDSDVTSTNGKIPRGSNTRGDDTHVYHQSVIKDGATYKMWYSGNDGANLRIYYATSSNGLEWTKYDNTVPANADGSSTNGKIPLGSGGRGDDVHTYTPSVIKDGATYKMWYSGYDGGIARIYYATSSNGLEWTKYDNNIPANSDSSSTNGKIPLGSAGRGDDTHAYQPSVIKDGATYKMWYSGYNGATGRIYYATSSNGLEWTKYDNTVPADSDGSSTNGKIPVGTATKGDPISANTLSVIKDGATYKMWYAGRTVGSTDRVYYVTSPDGLVWTKYDNSIPPNSNLTNTNGRIALGGSGTGDDAGVVRPSVIRDDATATYRIWYGGWDGTYYRIYLATVPTPPPGGTIFTLK